MYSQGQPKELSFNSSELKASRGFFASFFFFFSFSFLPLSWRSVSGSSSWGHIDSFTRWQTCTAGPNLLMDLFLYAWLTVVVGVAAVATTDGTSSSRVTECCHSTCFVSSFYHWEVVRVYTPSQRRKPRIRGNKNIPEDTVSVIYYCATNCHNSPWLKTHTIYTVIIGQNYGYGFHESSVSRSLTKLQSMSGKDGVSSEGLTGEIFSPASSTLLFDRIYFLCIYLFKFFIF